MESAAPAPPFREALPVWLKLGLTSFGGPAGQIALLHRELVERRRWIDEGRFLHALNLCVLLPGPEATQLAVYCGWHLHGRRGAFAAGALFILPAALLLWLLSWAYVAVGTAGPSASALGGLKASVVAIVAQALFRVGRRTLRAPWQWLVAAGALAAVALARLSYPLVVAAAALAGMLQSAPSVRAAPGPPVRLRRTLLDAGLLLALWFAPVLLARGTLRAMGLFFSKAAVVTFGGAYAVLPYVAQAAVERHGWLSPEQMLDGLGLAETTPGPLIIVLQFVGFLGCWNESGSLLRASLGAAMTTWVTFLPSFLFILAGAPFVERLRGFGRLQTALSGVTAAVVGVIAALALWFGMHALLPAGGGVDLLRLGIAVAAFLALVRFDANVVWVVLGSAAFGALAGGLGG